MTEPLTDVFSHVARNAPWTRLDIDEALDSYLLLRGNVPHRDVHPVAEAMVARGTRLVDIAAVLTGGRNLEGQALQRTLTSDDFGTSLGAAMSRAIGLSYVEQAQEHRAICAEFKSRGSKPIELPEIDLGELSQMPLSGGPFPNSMVTINAGTSVAPFIFSARFAISREMLINDSASVITLAVQQLSAHAARLEAQQIATAISTNGNLADGSALIGTGNSTTATGLDLTSLAEGMEILRTATTPQGLTANLKASFLLVPPSKEASALLLCDSIRNGVEPRLQVVCNAWLSAVGDDCYLLASPTAAPVFARVTPDSGTDRPEIETTANMDIDPVTGRPQPYDGLSYRFIHMVNVAPIARTGIAKITAA